jgi:hypothetical protein
MHHHSRHAMCGKSKEKRVGVNKPAMPVHIQCQLNVVDAG